MTNHPASRLESGMTMPKSILGAMTALKIAASTNGEAFASPRPE